MPPLSVRKLSPNLGNEVLDVDLTLLSDSTFAAIRDLWQRDPLVLFRRQSLTEVELIEFSRRFGELDKHTVKDLFDEATTDYRDPSLFFISNLRFADGTRVGGLSNSEVVWHTDLIYRSNPVSGTIFYAIEMPDGQGSTSFCNMAHAYDTLPTGLRNDISTLKTRCKYFTKNPLSSTMRDAINKGHHLEAESDSEENLNNIDQRTPPVIHPLVLENPATGQCSLYMSPNHTEAIEDMGHDQAQPLFDRLLEHALRPDNIYRHQWRNGDVLLWDNVRLLHRRDGFDDRLPRLAKRTTVYMDPMRFAVAS